MSTIDRVQGRVVRLALQVKRLRRKLGEQPEHRMSGRWAEKLIAAEHELIHISKYGDLPIRKQRPVGVRIDVPLAELGIKIEEIG